MRNMLKATTLERKFPLLAVENGCIISKDADLTVAFRVELPELFTVTSAEYEAIHSAWYKAVKVLPDYSIVHKQDFFIKENYQPDTERDELSFLSRSFERHFNERPFLNHYCYLFLTKTTRERSRRQSDFSTLCRGRIVPQEIADKEARHKEEISFLKAVVARAAAWFPYFREMLRIENLCRLVGFDERQTATLVKGKQLEYEGELYSEEHKRKFKTEKAGFQVLKDPTDGTKLVLAIDRKPIAEWFKEQFDKLRQSIHRPIQPQRKSRGMKL